MTATDTRPTIVGATIVSARCLAPDLARGAMLLLVALANACLYLYSHRPIGLDGFPIAESTAEQAVVMLLMILAMSSGLPLFAFLFGYGTVQLCRRLARDGVDESAVRRLLRRRGWCMVLIGTLHALLLFAGDIIAAFGLVAVAFAGVVVRSSDRKLLIAVGLWTVPIMAVGAWGTVTRPESEYLPLLRSLSITDPLAAVPVRLEDWIGLSLSTALIIAAPAALLGVLAARRGILDEPERHRTLLIRAAVLGLALGFAGCLPLALTAALWSPGWSPSASTAAAGLAHTLTGFAGAIGYAALAGLLAIRLRGRPGRVSTAVIACGQRSMTCYLLQSVLFVAMLASYGGGLGNRLGLVDTVVLAMAAWGLTVVLADGMARFGYRGPAEVLLRRLTYGRTK